MWLKRETSQVGDDDSIKYFRRIIVIYPKDPTLNDPLIHNIPTYHSMSGSTYHFLPRGVDSHMMVATWRVVLHNRCKDRVTPLYILIERQGPDHQPNFTFEVQSMQPPIYPHCY